MNNIEYRIILNGILALRRNSKFKRNKLYYVLAVTISSNKLKNIQSNKSLKEDLRSKILAGQNIPSYGPLNLHKGKTPLDTFLTSLCRKSFVPAPLSYNWLQLQTNFDSFRNRLRARYLFREIRIVTILQMLRNHQQKTRKMEISKNKLSRIGNISHISWEGFILKYQSWKSKG